VMRRLTYHRLFLVFFNFFLKNDDGTMTNQPFTIGDINLFSGYMACWNGIIVEYSEGGSAFYSLAFFLLFSSSFLLAPFPQPFPQGTVLFCDDVVAGEVG